MKKIIHQNADAGITQIFHSDDEGNITLETKQDVQAILDDNREQFNATTSLDRWGDGKKVASIPMSIYFDLKKRGIINDEAKLRAWLNDSNNAYFRTRPGKV